MTPEIRNLLKSLKALLENADSSTGVCMCGDDMKFHGYSDGHSPVDSGQYHAASLLEDIEKVLSC